jgi:hypothetical protein
MLVSYFFDDFLFSGFMSPLLSMLKTISVGHIWGEYGEVYTIGMFILSMKCITFSDQCKFALSIIKTLLPCQLRSFSSIISTISAKTNMNLYSFIVP